MKRFKKFKIILLISILLIICSLALNTKVVKAATKMAIDPDQTTGAEVISHLQGGGSIEFQYYDVVQNKYFFCRQHNVAFSRKDLKYTFVKDTSVPTIEYPDSNRNGGAWAYLFAKNYNASDVASAKTFSDRLLQKTFWAGFGNNGIWTSGSIPYTIEHRSDDAYYKDKINAMIDEANSYGNFEKNRVDDVVVVSLNPEEISELPDEDKPRTFGPFYIRSNLWEYPTGKIKAGITGFEIEGIDTDGNSIIPHYSIKIGSVTYGPYNGKLTLSNNTNVLLALNKATDGFKLIFNEELYQFQYTYQYKTIGADVTIMPLVSITANSTAQKILVVNPEYNEYINYYDSLLYVIEPPEKPTQKTVEIEMHKYSYSGITLNGAKFTVVAKQELDNGDNRLKVTKSSGVYTIQVGTNSDNTFSKNSIYVNIVETKAPSGYDTIRKNINLRLDYNETSGNFEPKFELTRKQWINHGFDASTWGNWIFTPGNNGNAWPHTYYSENGTGDKIVVDHNSVIKYDISVYDEQSPLIILNLGKYSISDLESSNKTILGNYKFRITATQSGKEILQDAIVTPISNPEIIINPISSNRSDITVEIVESIAPAGYNKASKITIKYQYSEEENAFVPVFTNSTWAAVNGMEDTYQSRTTNDIYQATQNYISFRTTSHDILVYDTPAPLKLKLNKANSFFAENRKNDLAGAKFTITAVQKNNSGGFDDLEIKTKTNNGTGSLANIVGGEEIDIVPKFVDQNNKIFVTITEDEAPAGYVPIDTPIVIEYVYNNFGKWNLRLCWEENQTDYTNAVGSNYPLWTWVVLDECDDIIKEEMEDNTEQIVSYDSNFPNVYCMYNGSDPAGEALGLDIPRVMTESFMQAHAQDITSVIKAERKKSNSNLQVIDIYNKREPSQINIDLAKYGINFAGDETTLIENTQQFRFNINVRQVGATDPIVIANNITMKNLSYSFNVETGSESDIYVAITEEIAPYNYSKIKLPINIKYTYDNGNWVPDYAVSDADLSTVGLTTHSGGWSQTATTPPTYESAMGDIITIDADGTICVYNNENAETHIDLAKTNVNGQIFADNQARFEFSISNIKSFEWVGIDTVTPMYGNTYHDANCDLGRMNLEHVYYDDPTKPIYITLREIEAPDEDYPLLNNGEEVYIEIPYQGTAHVVDAPNASGNVIENDLIDIVLINYYEPPVYDIHIINKKSITLSGNVWLDKSKVVNNKTNGGPNGIKDGIDTYMEGLEVQLYDGNTKVGESVYTDINGHYEFTNLDQPRTGYHVEILYDGIHYESYNMKLEEFSGRLNPDNEKYAYEVAERRNDFDKKFYYISKDLATNQAKTEHIDLQYNAQSELITKDNENHLLEDFTMRAITDNYNTNALNLDLALREKGTDISLSTGIVTKNNFKIRNYLNDYQASIYENNTKISDPAIIIDDENSYLIYKVEVTNQGKEHVDVNELTYYYDKDESNLRFDLEKTNAINTTINMNTVNIEDFYDVYGTGVLKIDMNNRKLIQPHTARTFFLAFRVNTARLQEGISVKNVVDLNMYSSTRSLIDKDSNPSQFLDSLVTYDTTEDDTGVCQNSIVINIP